MKIESDSSSDTIVPLNLISDIVHTEDSLSSYSVSMISGSVTGTPDWLSVSGDFTTLNTKLNAIPGSTATVTIKAVNRNDIHKLETKTIKFTVEELGPDQPSDRSVDQHNKLIINNFNKRYGK